jgi:hypothetical protein
LLRVAVELAISFAPLPAMRWQQQMGAAWVAAGEPPASGRVMRWQPDKRANPIRSTTMPHLRRDLALVLAGLPAATVLAGGPADAQGTTPETLDQPGKIMLTVFLRHDETKTVDEINAHLTHDYRPYWEQAKRSAG